MRKQSAAGGKSERDDRHRGQTDAEQPCGNTLPIEHAKHSQRGHARKEVTFVPLVRQGEDNKERDEPEPEEFLAVGHFLAPQESQDADRDGGWGEESCVERIRNNVAPHARSAPQQVGKVIFSLRVEFPDVFVQDKIRQQQVALRIEPIPEAENGERQNPGPHNLRCVSFQPRADTVFARVQGPPSQPGHGRRGECE